MECKKEAKTLFLNQNPLTQANKTFPLETGNPVPLTQSRHKSSSLRKFEKLRQTAKFNELESESHIFP